MATRQIGIIGAGNLMAAHACFLASNRMKVSVATLPGHHGITEAVNRAEGVIHDLRTQMDTEITFCSIEELMELELIFITTPTHTHKEVIDVLVEYDLTDKTIIVIPGGLFTALTRKRLRPDLFPETILETSTSPYVSRVEPGTNQVSVTGTKVRIEISCSQSRQTAEFKGWVGSLFPQDLYWYPNLSSILFARDSSVFHPAGLLTKLPELLEGRQLLFYQQCVPDGGELIERVDQERIAAAQFAGIDTLSILDFSNTHYGKEATSFADFARELEAYSDIQAPNSADHRYFREEIPIIQVFRKIAAGYGIATPAMDGLVTEVQEALEDFEFQNEILDALDLSEATSDEIVSVLNMTIPHAAPHEAAGCCYPS